MSLVESISRAFQKRRLSAREEYIKALRAGRSADQIAELAVAAGITPEQVTAAAGILDKAAELREQIEKLPAAQKSLTEATRRIDEADGAIQAILAKWQPLLQQAQWDHAAADKSVRECKVASNELAGLHQNYPDLLPPDTAPQVIRDGWTADQRAAADVTRKRAAMAALQAAVDRLESAKKESEAAFYGYAPTVPGIVGSLSDPKEWKSTQRSNAAAKGFEAAKKQFAEASQAALKIGAVTEADLARLAG